MGEMNTYYFENKFIVANTGAILAVKLKIVFKFLCLP